MSTLERIRILEENQQELEENFSKLLAVVQKNQEHIMALQLIEELLAKIKTKSN
jgi:hypothetical protein